MASPSRCYTKEDFYGEEDTTRCTFDKDGLLGATLPKLVLKLTSPENSAFCDALGTHCSALSIDAFLLTYRSFTTPDALVDCLAARCEQADASESTVVRFRVCTLLSKWIDRYTFDFIKDCPALAEKVKVWLTDVVQALVEAGDKTSKVPQQVLGKLEKMKLSGYTEKDIVQDQTQTKCPKPIIPKDPETPLLLGNLEELARQITIREWHVWKECKPWHFLGLSWTKDTNKNSPLLKLITQFNALSDWVAATLCTTENLKERGKTLLAFLLLAQHLKKLNNLNGLMAVLSGLQRGPLMRLRLTEEIAKQKDFKTFELYAQLQDLTSSTKSYKNLRGFMSSLTPPCIPYVGMYLSDLTFIEEGNPDLVGEHKLINIYKRLLISKSISELRLWQITAYHFVEIPSILSKLDQTTSIPEKQLYELSYFLEPREGKEPGPRPEILAALHATRERTTSSSKKGKWKIKTSGSSTPSNSTTLTQSQTHTPDQQTHAPEGSAAGSEDREQTFSTPVPITNTVTSPRRRSSDPEDPGPIANRVAAKSSAGSRSAWMSRQRSHRGLATSDGDDVEQSSSPSSPPPEAPSSPSIKIKSVGSSNSRKNLHNALTSSAPTTPTTSERGRKEGSEGESEGESLRGRKREAEILSEEADQDTRSMSPFTPRDEGAWAAKDRANPVVITTVPSIPISGNSSHPLSPSHSASLCLPLSLSSTSPRVRGLSPSSPRAVQTSPRGPAPVVSLGSEPNITDSAENTTANVPDAAINSSLVDAKRMKKSSRAGNSSSRSKKDSPSQHKSEASEGTEKRKKERKRGTIEENEGETKVETEAKGSEGEATKETDPSLAEPQKSKRAFPPILTAKPSNLPTSLQSPTSRSGLPPIGQTNQPETQLRTSISAIPNAMLRRQSFAVPSSSPPLSPTSGSTASPRRQSFAHGDGSAPLSPVSRNKSKSSASESTNLPPPPPLPTLPNNNLEGLLEKPRKGSSKKKHEETTNTK